MKKILSFAGKLGILIVPFLLPVSAWAFILANPGATNAGPGPAYQTNPGATPPSAGIYTLQDVMNLICIAFDYAFWFLMALAVIFGIIAAFGYLTAAGEAEKVKKANDRLLYAAIAIAVALLARAIPSIVASFFTLGALPSC